MEENSDFKDNYLAVRVMELVRIKMEGLVYGHVFLSGRKLPFLTI